MPTRVPLVQRHGVPPPCDVNVEDVHGRHGQAAAAEFAVPAKDGRGHITARRGAASSVCLHAFPRLGVLPGGPAFPQLELAMGIRLGWWKRRPKM